MRSIILFHICFLIPVFILAQDTLVLQPGPEDGVDALISSIYPNTNKGDQEYYHAFTWTFSGEPGTGRTFFQFDLSVLPHNTLIYSAYLDLYGNPYFTADDLYHHTRLSGPNNFYMRRVVEPWEELAITWNNQPPTTLDGQVELPASTFAEQNYLGTDVTDFVRFFVENPQYNYGLCIQLRTEEYYRSICFISSDFEEPEFRPRLTIIYQVCDPPVSDWTYRVDDKYVIFSYSGSSGDEWLWDFDDGYLSTLPNPEHTYSEYGFYNVCLTVTDSCGSSTFCDTVVVCNFSQADFGYEASGKTVTFSDSSINATGWWWNFGDGYYSSEQNPFHSYKDYGDYQVCLEASNDCSSEVFCDSVKLIEGAGIYNPGEILAELFPNPCSDRLNLTLTNPASLKNLKISVYNVFGEIVIHLNTGNTYSDFTIDVGSLTSGIYILRATDERVSSVWKFIKKE